ncbi:hypothetical protein SERLADRAFT_466863 [Serpula lacrymans var. lacrymans S7.9]|uniref:Uncharacterized protein n=1 Tax=Serpula lacrymans var. lacrymans (strain S7.9) TaxID=578457 RepID=F8NV25_SERL9|nr:uncharacterized protein SERLADRAFT_466863 [Serpula lacrymans var. lacrymans S7.9]EGO25980.1 hypothetical protein SERLADRAFT_466863 [Serpula lacrymans var. lacrymans S7.9]
MRCARQDEKWLQAHMILVIWDSSNSPSFREVLRWKRVQRRVRWKETSTLGAVEKECSELELCDQ